MSRPAKSIAVDFAAQGVRCNAVAPGSVDTPMLRNSVALADDPERLRSHGIEAIYGNATYKKLRPGLIYVFKISNTGQVHPETVPAL